MWESETQALSNKVTNLENEMELMRQVNARLTSDLVAKIDTLNNVATAINELISDGVISDPQTISALSQFIDIDAEREVEVTFKAEVTVTVTLPYGKDAENLDFTLDVSSWDGYDVSVVDYNVYGVSSEEL